MSAMKLEFLNLLQAAGSADLQTDRDSAEPAKWEKTAKAKADGDCHAVHAVSPGQAASVPPSPDEQATGIPISSPGPEAGPTSPGEMTQVSD